MEGGLPAFIKAGGELETSSDQATLLLDDEIKDLVENPGDYKSTNYFSGITEPLKNTGAFSFVDKTVVQTAAKTDSTLILDARPPARFYGEVPEPRAGVRSGHIPGSSNLLFSEYE